MTRPLVELGPADRRLLVGKLVRVCSARLGGGFVALVRSASARELTVQRPGGPRVLDGGSISARCRGARVRVFLLEVDGVVNRRKKPGEQVEPLALFLERERARGRET